MALAAVSADRRYNAMLMTTCVATMLNGAGDCAVAASAIAGDDAASRGDGSRIADHARHVGNIPINPGISTGATDSRFYRALGVPAVGVSGLFSDPTVDARAHGRDERMSIKSYYEGQVFLYRLTKALTSSPRTVVP